MDYFAKKQWIRIAVCAVLVVAATLAMIGVFSGNKPLRYPDSDTYSSTKENNFSKITVTASAKSSAAL